MKVWHVNCVICGLQALAEYCVAIGRVDDAAQHLASAVQLCEARFCKGHPLNIATMLQFARTKVCVCCSCRTHCQNVQACKEPFCLFA
jgi:hypothetical protein